MPGQALVRLVAALGVSLLASACVSYVDVRKADATTPGLRYSLPDTYLLVKPKVDGAAEYEWLYLPNRDKEYAIQARSLLSTYTLELEIEKGLLKKATTKGTSSDAASTLLSQSATVLEAEMKAQTKAATEHAAAIETARKAVLAAEVAYAKAVVKLDAYRNAGEAISKDKLIEAELDVLLKQKDLDAAQAELARLRGGSADNAAANAPPSGVKQAWGPLLFRVALSGDAVELRAVNTQELFPTSGAPAKNPAPATPMRFNVTARSAARVMLVASQPIAKVEKINHQLGRGGMPQPATIVSAVLDTDLKTVEVKFSPALVPGTYSLSISYASTGTPDKVQISSAIELVIP